MKRLLKVSVEQIDEFSTLFLGQKFIGTKYYVDSEKEGSTSLCIAGEELSVGCCNIQIAQSIKLRALGIFEMKNMKSIL